MGTPVTEAVQNFLHSIRDQHNGPDLLDRVTRSMEIQVLVSGDGGTLVEDRLNTWTNGVYNWYHIRIPKHADTKPEWTDYNLQFPLDKHVLAIGCTGFNWVDHVANWVAFDFDAITNHAAGIGVTDTELHNIRDLACRIPWVEVRNSTSGKGLHLYVPLQNMQVANHRELAALARCILGLMSSDVGFDFARQVDACGQNMWIYHVKATKENKGLALIKPASTILRESDIPKNWKAHLDVISKKRSKIRINEVVDESPFDELTATHRCIPLDNTHRTIIDELIKTGYATVWVSDHHLLQTHTKALALLLETRRSALNLKGIFQTNSPASDPGKPNCFGFPLPDGAFRFYRFHLGIIEAPTWDQDGKGWTSCYFNVRPDLDTVARAIGALQRADGAYNITDIAMLERFQNVTGLTIMDQHWHSQKPSLSYAQPLVVRCLDGKLLLQISNKIPQIPGWDNSKRGCWSKLFTSIDVSKIKDDQKTDFDQIVRSVVSPVDKVFLGWWYFNKLGEWFKTTENNVRGFLLNKGISVQDVDKVKGALHDNSWAKVHIPFGPTYPGNRQWNFDVPSLRYEPSEKPGPHPHWDLILDHIGSDLTYHLKSLTWAQQYNIITGASYLRAWIASVIRYPFAPLPYLFLFGPQNCGKSILWQSLEILIKDGVVSATSVLRGNEQFNSDFVKGVIAYVDEKDLTVKNSKNVYATIKDLVDAPMIRIRKMHHDPYRQPNSLHWIQTANELSYCPVLPGDTRIVVIWVPPLKNEVFREEMFTHLRAEAPNFLRTILDYQLPDPRGRLRIPVIDTGYKFVSEDANLTALERFLRDECYYVPGKYMPFNDFVQRFLSWLPEDERGYWHNKRTKIALELPGYYVVGRMKSCGHTKFIGNISFENDKASTSLVCVNGILEVREEVCV